MCSKRFGSNFSILVVISQITTLNLEFGLPYAVPQNKYVKMKKLKYFFIKFIHGEYEKKFSSFLYANVLLKHNE